MPARYTMDYSTNVIRSFDPSGGPMLSIGGKLDDGIYISFILNEGGNIFVYVEDTEEKAKNKFDEMSAQTETSGSGGCVSFLAEPVSKTSVDATLEEESQKIMIGMIGKAGSGKDTVADYIVEKYGFSKIAFADPLKQAVQVMFDVDDEHMFDRVKREEPLPGWEPWTVRKLLQFVGTDLMRNQIDEDIWVKNAVSRVRKGTLMIISDVRFPNEIDLVRELVSDEFKTLFIKVHRPDHEDAAGGIANHASEANIDNLKGDVDLFNDGTLDDLYRRLM